MVEKEARFMAIVYDKLFALLKENGITSYTLRKMESPFISQATLTAIKSGKGGLDHRTINNICKYFNCQPADIMEYIPDDAVTPPPAE